MNAFVAEALKATRTPLGRHAIRVTAALAAVAIVVATVDTLRRAAPSLFDTGPTDATALLASNLKTLLHVPLQAQAMTQSVLAFFGFL